MRTNPRTPVLTLLREKRALWLLALVVLLLVAVPVGLRTLAGPNAAQRSTVPQDAPAGERQSAAQPPNAGASSPESTDSADAPAGTEPSGAAGTPGLSPLTAPKVSRDAWMGLKVSDLVASSAQVRSIGSAAGGSVTSERVVTGPSDGAVADGENQSRSYRDSSSTPARSSGGNLSKNEARLTLKVPAPKLDGVLAELARIGTVSYRSSQVQDVSNDYVDAQARVEPARASVTRIQALLAQATDLKQVVLIESELSKRQADLDSLTQRLASLDQRTSMSEVTVTLWAGERVETASDQGFVGGLLAARDGLVGSVSVITVGLATLAPWLLLIALLGWTVLRVQRRRPPSSRNTPSTGQPPVTATAEK